MVEQPTPKDPSVSARMRTQAVRDTEPELLVRRELHRRGLRYRVHYKAIEGSARRVDIAFPRERVAIDVRGCFWHACPLHASWPKSNAQWWRSKLEVNKRRDADTAMRLRVMKWELVVVWGHEDPIVAAEQIETLVKARRNVSYAPT